ncbi:MAG TPA: DUF1206 domain-containing protein [Thermoanaerobaculia bacterium]
MRSQALARIGFAAAGVLYVALGVASARVAILGVRDPSGVPGAVRLILRTPHGRVLAIAVAVGLAGFAVWHVSQVRRRRGLARRAGHLASAAGYAALAGSMLSALARLHARGPAWSRTALAWLLERPWGVAAIEIAGILTVAGGVSEIWQGVTGRLRQRFAAGWLPRDAARFAHRTARFGLAARGVVLVVIGVFQVRVARDLDPRELREVGGALRVLAASSVGGAAIAGVVAAGLAAYGLYMGVLAASPRRS